VTQPHATQTPVFIAPDAFVLQGHELREGIGLAATSRFGDDVWDLDPINHQDQLVRNILNFPTLPEQFRVVTKELFYALLVGELPPGEVRLKQSSIRSAFTHVKKSMDWAHERGCRTLASITQEDLLEYHQWLLNTDLAPSQRGMRRRALRLFWVFRDSLHTDRLTLDPQRLQSWQVDNTQPPRRIENATDRIPEEVISPLLVWALRWVTNFSEDILAAREEWWALYAARHAMEQRKPFAGGQVSARLAALQQVLDDYRTARRPLPTNGDGQVNANFLARQLRTEPSFISRPQGRAMVATAVAELGLADGSYLFTQAQVRLDGAPWLPGFDYHRMPQLSRMLQTACYVVIAYLSGMRDSEVKHLQRGCLSRHRDSDGNVYRRTITSRAFKGETPKGVTASWVVSESVERAVAVLENLQPADAKYLFTTLVATQGWQGSDRSMTNKCTNTNLNEMVHWVNTYCASHGRVDGIPLVRRQRWRLNTSQFRRTLAWFIARRPGGTIAGTIQYRHHSIQMFEGYAGTSESGFRGEVEAEQTLQRGERLLAMIENHEHLDLRGPGAQEAQMRLTNLQRSSAYTGSVVTDRRRLQRIMDREDPHIYFGHFVTCIYNPEKALCRRQLSNDGGQTMPDLASCQPLQCRNVALTSENVKALATQLHKLDTHLAKADLLAPYVAHRLEEQRRNLAALLDSATGVVTDDQ
jgi:hypothetical protein